jgi:hypothetical protein
MVGFEMVSSWEFLAFCCLLLPLCTFYILNTLALFRSVSGHYVMAG